MNSSKGTISLVLGIIGAIVGIIWVPLIGIILGIIAIVLANGDRKVMKTGVNTAGLILGIVSLVGSVVMWVVAAVLLVSIFM